MSKNEKSEPTTDEKHLQEQINGLLKEVEDAIDVPAAVLDYGMVAREVGKRVGRQVVVFPVPLPLGGMKLVGYALAAS